MKKYEKLIIVLGITLLFGILTWFIEAGVYNSGLFTSSGIVRMGLFDFFLVLYYGFYFRTGDIIYLLSIGGLYGVLSQTTGYRKIISKVAKLIGGKEIIAMLVITFIMGVYASFASQLLPLLIFVPFIITVFLKRGKDRITAISAAMGGIFIGYFGQTFGSYGINELMSAMSFKITNAMAFKIVTFVFAYGLFNLFAILHMKKGNTVNELRYDPFTTKKLDETGVKKNKQAKIWPTILVLSILIVLTLLSYINWFTSFNIEIFDNLHKNIGNVTLADVPVLKSLLGNFTAFGTSADMLPLSCIIAIASLIIALVNKINFFDWLGYYGEGMKKMGKVAVIYALCSAIFVVAYYFPWSTTLINWLFGSGKFSVFSLLIIAFLIAFFFIDPEYSGFVFGTYLTATFADKIVATSLIMHLGSAFAMILVPTSLLLMVSLTYLDVPYMKWLKYIWKFAGSMFIVVLIALAIMCNI